VQEIKPGRAILGGFIGTAIMTALLYIAPVVGLPKMDIAGTLGMVLDGKVPAAWSEYWCLGLVWHLVNGSIVFSMAYSDFTYGWLPGAPWVRGVGWGVAVWLLMEVVFMPMLGRGVFSDHVTGAFAGDMVALVLHALYGAILGAVAGRQAERGYYSPHMA
jgi:Family of unknown function (DUF6789)